MVNPIITLEMNDNLRTLVSIQEIKEAIFSLMAYRTLEPYEFSRIFIRIIEI